MAGKLPSDIFYIRSDNSQEVRIRDLKEDDTIISYITDSDPLFAIYSGLHIDDGGGKTGYIEVNRVDTKPKLDFDVDGWKYCLRLKGVHSFFIVGSVSEYREAQKTNKGIRSLMEKLP